MSGACCVDPGAKQSHDAQGTDEKIGGVNTYKTGNGKSAIVIFTDVFGYSFVNVRKVADSFAQGSQTTVLIPDCFNGDPISPDVPNLFDVLPVWIKKHPPTDACNLAETFLSAIKGNYQSIQVNLILKYLFN
jgi:dienelactone hydrolase